VLAQYFLKFVMDISVWKFQARREENTGEDKDKNAKHRVSGKNLTNCP
jgi:hypothetical protein